MIVLRTTIPVVPSQDTKRWCKGKIGRGHDCKLTKQTTGLYTWLSFDTWTCTQCGKGGRMAG
jgi:hypothetical protein